VSSERTIQAIEIVKYANQYMYFLCFSPTRGVNECNIVVSGNLISLVEDVLKDEVLLSKQTNLSSISIKLPRFHCFFCLILLKMHVLDW